MAEPIECANKICTHKGAECSVKCPLCLGATYCSATCAAMDWVSHACPNATLVEARAPATPWVPYWGEDALALEEVAKLPADAVVRQSWSVTTRLPNDTVVQTQVPSLLLPIGRDVSKIAREVPPNYLRGEAPPDTLKDKFYWVIITRLNRNGEADGLPIVLMGNFGQDAVHVGSTNSRILKLMGKGKSWRPSDLGLRFASKISPKGHHLVLWPDPAGLVPFDNETFDVVGSRLRVELTDYAPDPSSGEISEEAHLIRVEGPLDLSGAAKQHGVVGALSKQWSARMKAKFRGMREAESLAQMYGYRATVDDVTVHLIFRVARNAVAATLADVELEFAPEHFTSSNVKRVNIYESISAGAVPLECNPRSLEDVTALAMGLELRLTKARVAGEPVDALLDNAAGLVRKHQRALESGKFKLGADEMVPMDVNTAIYTAVNAL